MKVKCGGKEMVEKPEEEVEEIIVSVGIKRLLFSRFLFV